MVKKPAMDIADAVCASVWKRSTDGENPTESEIPIVQSMLIRGSYLSGFTYACRRPKPFDDPEGQLRRR